MISRLLLTVLALSVVSPAMAQDKAVPQSPQQVQLSFAPIVKQVSPAVVNIYTKRTVSRQVTSPFMSDPFFAQLFGGQAFGGRMRQQVESALGSGVILSADGLVVTNAHVIKGAEEITVGLADGREFEATLSLLDEASDLALLRVDEGEANLPHATLKPSESLEVGDLVLAIGNPFGVGQTVTSGIVSAQGRSSLNINDFNFFIQTDAAINPGNSGGALVALDGGVVGINTAIYSRDGGSLGIGFAIPSEMVASVIAAEEGGRTGAHGVVRPWLGVTAQTVTSDIANSLGMARPQGALVAALHSRSPLKAAGINIGDVVLSMNGKAIRDPSEMKFRMATVPLGQAATVDVSQKGERKTFQVKAMAPPEEPPREETLLDGAHLLRGATIANVNPAVATELAMLEEEEGVVVSDIERGSLAGRVVRPGDILLSINGQEIKTVQDAQNALKKPSSGGLSLSVKSNGRIKNIMLR